MSRTSSRIAAMIGQMNRCSTALDSYVRSRGDVTNIRVPLMRGEGGYSRARWAHPRTSPESVSATPTPCNLCTSPPLQPTDLQTCRLSSTTGRAWIPDGHRARARSLHLPQQGEPRSAVVGWAVSSRQACERAGVQRVQKRSAHAGLRPPPRAGGPYPLAGGTAYLPPTGT